MQAATRSGGVARAGFREVASASVTPALTSYTAMISASFFFSDLVDLLDVLVGQLLDLGHGLLLVVLADLVVLQHLLQVVVDVAAHVADGHPALLRVLVRVLDQQLAPLLGERRARGCG